MARRLQLDFHQTFGRLGNRIYFEKVKESRDANVIKLRLNDIGISTLFFYVYGKTRAAQFLPY